MPLVCSISGAPPEEPVLSKTGFIFEKRLIEKHIETNGKCPLTGVELEKSDLQPINTSNTVKPRPVTAASLPGLLSIFQSEWDSIMMETYQLRSQLEIVRNQLSHSLYQHDAATRVIARLLKELETSGQQVKDLQAQLATAKVADPSELEAGISDELLKRMQDLALELLAKRKKRVIDGVLNVDRMKTFASSRQYMLHSAATPGVMCVDIDPKSANRIASGGADAVVCLFDLNKQKTLCRLQGHLKKLNDVKIHPTEHVIISASDDKTVRVWKGDEDDSQYKCSYIIRKHRGSAKSISFHPLNEYFATSGLDKSWNLFELDSGNCLLSNKNLNCNYRCISFHPDGMILGGGGEDGTIQIWDMKEAQLRVCLPGHSGPISSLAFSENGYYLASASDDGTVRLWDLRSTVSFQTINVGQGGSSSVPNAIKFDNSGEYLAIAAPDIAVYHFEKRASMSLAVTLSNHSGPVTDVSFGPNASCLISTSMDRTVRVWEPTRSSG